LGTRHVKINVNYERRRSRQFLGGVTTSKRTTKGRLSSATNVSVKPASPQHWRLGRGFTAVGISIMYESTAESVNVLLLNP
jgi:hypothetical protein